MLFTRKTWVKMLMSVILIITILQFFLKLGGHKGIFRYGLMWLAVYGRLMFCMKMLGYDSNNHYLFDSVPFVMSLVLFFNLNSNAAFSFNKVNIVAVIVLEVILFLIYKDNEKYIYIIEEDNDEFQ